ncbi:hypothetical protein E8L90_19580 [Brevibacillus antibioticus]|uniref:Uncharacterized protein n=2 Tax=Brevibacillus antibioticus TaxID=2570228 RepID=A0A4U2Y9T2_9BACL|nr:hypothetical protein E8L90_19580 [Brevibacillus antibioticus]
MNITTQMTENEFNIELDKYTITKSSDEEILEQLQKLGQTMQEKTIVRENTGFLSRIQLDQPKPALTCQKLNSVLKDWNVTSSQLEKPINDLKQLQEALESIPKQSRELIAALLPKCKTADVWDVKLQISLPFAERYLNISHIQLIDEIHILEKAGLASYDYGFDNDDVFKLSIYPANVDWPAYTEIMEFARVESIPLSRIIVDLDSLFSINRNGRSEGTLRQEYPLFM